MSDSKARLSKSFWLLPILILALSAGAVWLVLSQSGDPVGMAGGQGEAAPLLVCPRGNTRVSPTPTFHWAPAYGATYYQVWINNVSDGNKLVYKQWLKGESVTSFTLPEKNALVIGKTHRWWVRGWNQQKGSLPWSKGYDFYVGRKRLYRLGAADFQRLGKVPHKPCRTMNREKSSWQSSSTWNSTKHSLLRLEALPPRVREKHLSPRRLVADPNPAFPGHVACRHICSRGGDRLGLPRIQRLIGPGHVVPHQLPIPHDPYFRADRTDKVSRFVLDLRYDGIIYVGRSVLLGLLDLDLYCPI